MRLLAPTVLMGALATIGMAQPATPAPEFEVASVKPAPPPDGSGIRVGCHGGPGSTDPGLYTCTNINLSNFVSMAFALNPYQNGSADFGDRTMYNLTAKVPPGTTREQFQQMLQKLVIDRFKLQYHWEKKEMPAYNLVVAKGGIRMKESPPDPPAGADDPNAAQRRGGMTMNQQGAKWNAFGVDMKRVASMLGVQMRGPVTDSTGLFAKYDFVLTWVGSGLRASTDDNPGPTIEEAVQEQLGLKLESRKAPVDVFIIDHAEKVAIEN